MNDGRHWLQVEVRSPLNGQLVDCLPKQIDPYELSGDHDPAPGDVQTLEILTQNKCHFRIEINPDFNPTTAFLPPGIGQEWNRGYIHQAVARGVLQSGTLAVTPGTKLDSANFKVTAYQPKFALNSFSPRNVSSAQSTVSLALTASATGGYQNIGIINILGNTWLSGYNACYLVYYRPTGMLGLLDDQGGNVSWRAIGASTPILENSQCTVLAGESVSTAGDQLTLTNLTLQAKAAWVNVNDPTKLDFKQFYVAVRSEAAAPSGADLFAGTGWLPAGVWRAPNTGTPYLPRFDSVSISTPNNLQANVTLQLKHNAFKPLEDTWVIVNDFLDASGSCYSVFHLASPTSTVLRTAFNDDGFVSVPPGGTSSNPYCSITNPVIQHPDSTTISVSFLLTFQQPVTGPRTVWAASVSYAPPGSGFVDTTTNWVPIAEVWR